ncbi:MAG: serine/threonine-protein phosphatase [Clostridia bacterium]|nr:serine/threonine-protein phosphatase [Clostridia bacterium]
MGYSNFPPEKLTASNAGHEYPVIKRAGGAFDILRDKHGFVIGGLAKSTYKNYELTLSPGDKIFLYTDGVPEATDAENNLFGQQRMLDALNGAADEAPEQILNNVRREVDAFVKDAEQFDDLTMLCIEYKGQGEEKNDH